MDQAKWAVPRTPGTRACKSMVNLSKPKFKVQGCWCHGTLLRLYVLDPRVPADSSTVIEFLVCFLMAVWRGQADKLIAKTSEWQLKVLVLYLGWVESVQPRCLSQTIQEVKDIFVAKEVPLPNQLIVMESCFAVKLLPLASTVGKRNQARNPNRCFGCFELTWPLRPTIAFGKTKTATWYGTWVGL